MMRHTMSKSLLLTQPLMLLLLFTLITNSFANAAESASQFKILKVNNTTENSKDRAGLGDRIQVHIDSLSALSQLTGNNIKNIKLKINDQIIADSEPLKIDDNTLEYKLISTEKSKAVWDSLRVKSNKALIPVTISVGQENSSIDLPVTAQQNNFILILRDQRTFTFLFIFGLILFLLTFLKLNKKDARLRNYGPESTYSLALVQMAIWYYVVTIGYLYIYIITGNQPVLNNSILVLLGISSGTAVGARIIDGAKVDKQTADSADCSPNNEEPKANDKNSVLNKLENIKSSGNIFIDILSDEYGIALSRFQVLVWTCIVVFIFVHDVYSTMKMPDFSDSNVLILMGISSGSYIGYKIKEDYSRKTDNAKG
ncbi:MAG: hypothetical protein WCK32_08515 [Chlorobiaceae bacterium]